MIEDLSYSNIVDKIQGDITIGGDILVDIAKEKEKVDREILDTEIKLQQLQTKQLQLRKGSLSILKHLGKDTPLVIKRDNFIVMVEIDDITIERNVI